MSGEIVCCGYCGDELEEGIPFYRHLAECRWVQLADSVTPESPSYLESFEFEVRPVAEPNLTGSSPEDQPQEK